MSAYKIHEEAQEDLNTIWECLAEQASPTIATSIEDKFFQAFALLSTQPSMSFQRLNLTSATQQSALPAPALSGKSWGKGQRPPWALQLANFLEASKLVSGTSVFRQERQRYSSLANPPL